MKNRLFLLGISLLSTAILIAVGIGWLRGDLAAPKGGAAIEVASLPSPLNRLPSSLTTWQALHSWAQTWADDYALVSTNTVLDVAGESALGWSFVLYSARQQQLVSLLVSPTEIRLLHKQPALYRPRLVDVERWQYDGTSVLAAWWEERAKAHWQEMGVARIVLTLRQDRAGYPLWKLVALNDDGAVLDAWYVRADNGHVVESPVAP